MAEPLSEWIIKIDANIHQIAHKTNPMAYKNRQRAFSSKVVGRTFIILSVKCLFVAGKSEK